VGTYTVSVPELWYSHVDIEADSEEDALNKVREGEGEYGQSEYSHTIEEDWQVTPHPEG
jgi:hypothetical protein